MLINSLRDNANEKPPKSKKAPEVALDSTLARTSSLSYAYFDVTDSDGDVIRRIILHILPAANASVPPLLPAVLTENILESGLQIAILLDWREPWNWCDQLSFWISTLEGALGRARQANSRVDELLKAQTQELEHNIRAYTEEQPEDMAEKDILLDLEQGQFDRPLGLRVTVICQNEHHMLRLEQDHPREWNSAKFDLIQQFLRTLLLKHGSSLIYASPSNLSHIYSHLVRSDSIPPQILQRDKLCIPVGWDSFDRIKITNTDFDPAGISDSWDADLQGQGTTSAIDIWHDAIAQPKDLLFTNQPPEEENEIASSIPHQEFLAQLYTAMNPVDKQQPPATPQPKSASHNQIEATFGTITANVGGIDLNVNEATARLERMKAHAVSSTPIETSSPPDRTLGSTPSSVQSNAEKLTSFFQRLKERGATPSPGG